MTRRTISNQTALAGLFVCGLTMTLTIASPAQSGGVVSSPRYSKVCNNGNLAGSGTCPANPAPGLGATQWGCTLDNTTSLMWEVKTQTGPRGYGKAYTSFDDPTRPQKSTGADPTAAEVAAPTNSMGYVATTNAGGMCGKSNWRLPTYNELKGLTVPNPAPNSVKIDADFFPFTGFGHPVPLPYTTSMGSAGTPDKMVYMVNFYTGLAQQWPRDHPSHIRLVSANGQQCQTIQFDESNPWASTGKITLPGFPQKLVSMTGSVTIAGFGTFPVQTGTNQSAANQFKAGPFSGLGNKFVNLFMLPVNHTPMPPISQSGAAHYVTKNGALESGNYIVPGMSVWPDGTIHAHGNITGTVTLCVQ